MCDNNYIDSNGHNNVANFACSTRTLFIFRFSTANLFFQLPRDSVLDAWVHKTIARKQKREVMKGEFLRLTSAGSR